MCTCHAEFWRYKLIVLLVDFEVFSYVMVVWYMHFLHRMKEVASILGSGKDNCWRQIASGKNKLLLKLHSCGHWRVGSWLKVSQLETWRVHLEGWNLIAMRMCGIHNSTIFWTTKFAWYYSFLCLCWLLIFFF